MKFNCGAKEISLSVVLTIIAAFICLPFVECVRKPTPPEPVRPPAVPPTASVSSPPLSFPGPPTSADPVLRAWQTAIRVRDAKGVLNAQSAFLDREGEYREKLMAMAKEDADPRIRAFSVAVLGRMKSPPPESYFLERLDDASEHPRTSALQALEKIGTGACLPRVDGLASSDPAGSVRAAAAKAAKAVRSR